MKPENLSPDLELTYRNYFSEECVDNGGLRGRHEGGSPRLSSPLLSSSSLSTFSPTDSGQPSPDHRAQYVQLKNERMDYRYIGVLWALTSSHANCQTHNKQLKSFPWEIVFLWLEGEVRCLPGCWQTDETCWPGVTPGSAPGWPGQCHHLGVL